MANIADAISMRRSAAASCHKTRNGLMAISRERRFMDFISGKGFHADALGSLTRDIQRCEADRWQLMEVSISSRSADVSIRLTITILGRRSSALPSVRSAMRRIQGRLATAALYGPPARHPHYGVPILVWLHVSRRQSTP